MYGVPDDLDLSRFRGAQLELETVLLTSNTVGLTFSGGLRVTVESRFEHRLETGVLAGGGEIPARACELGALIGSTIARADSENGRDLLLTFDNNHTLKIVDDSEQYESYQILMEGSETII